MSRQSWPQDFPLATRYFYVATKSWPRERFSCRDRVSQYKKRISVAIEYISRHDREFQNMGFPMARHSALCHDNVAHTTELGRPRLGVHDKKMRARKRHSIATKWRYIANDRAGHDRKLYRTR